MRITERSDRMYLQENDRTQKNTVDRSQEVSGHLVTRCEVYHFCFVFVFLFTLSAQEQKLFPRLFL